MAVNFDVSPVREFAHSFSGASASDWLWQIGVAVVALALGWYAARLFTREVHSVKRWQFGKEDFDRVVYPLLVLAFTAIGKVILQRFQTVALLKILVSLLVAWVVIRIAAYVLGHVLPKGGFLRASIRTIAWIAWIGVLLHLTGLLPEVIAVLEDIGISVGNTRITVWLVLQALAALAFTLALAAWISRVTESRVLAADSLEMSTRVVITKLVRVVTMFLAILVALPLVGIDITALSIFSGALGVGLGFGLQKIASNYVSGFIVLLDRSLRIGDLITVDGRKGNVMAIQSRYTVIKGSDGTESIIPNEKLITESVYHHTFSDTKAAVPMVVSVSYDSDVERALELMLQAARAQKRVIPDPVAVARVKQFTESGIELELVCWITDPAAGDADLKSDVYKALLVAFRQAGIQIPFPRRDVRLLPTGETKEAPFNSGS